MARSKKPNPRFIVEFGHPAILPANFDSYRDAEHQARLFADVSDSVICILLPVASCRRGKLSNLIEPLPARETD